jgi:hypothetical protein
MAGTTLQDIKQLLQQILAAVKPAVSQSIKPASIQPKPVSLAPMAGMLVGQITSALKLQQPAMNFARVMQPLVSKNFTQSFQRSNVQNLTGNSTALVKNTANVNVPTKLSGATQAAGVVGRAVGTAGRLAGANANVPKLAGAAQAAGAVAGAAGGGGGSIMGAVMSVVGNLGGVIGKVVVIAGTLLVSLGQLPQLLKDFAQGLFDTNRQFAEASGAMARVFAVQERAQFLRNKEVGDFLAPSAGEAGAALNAFEDAKKIWVELLGVVKNKIATLLANAATWLLNVLKPLLDAIAYFFDVKLPSDQEKTTLDWENFLGAFARAGAQGGFIQRPQRQVNDPRARPAIPGWF